MEQDDITWPPARRRDAARPRGGVGTGGGAAVDRRRLVVAARHGRCGSAHGCQRPHGVTVVVAVNAAYDRQTSDVIPRTPGRRRVRAAAAATTTTTEAKAGTKTQMRWCLCQAERRAYHHAHDVPSHHHYHVVFVGHGRVFVLREMLFCLKLAESPFIPPPAPRTAPHTLQGLVLLSTELHLQDEGGCGDNNEPPLRSKDFREICITASAEFPGMVMAGLLVDRLGRRKLQALDFGIVACALSVLLFFSGDISHTTRQVMLFVGRACMMGAFTVLFTYTAEVYSTNIRSTAFGVCNSFSRIGGMVAPFVGEGLIARGENQLAIGLFAGFCAAAAVLCLFLPIETAGRSLEGPSGAAPAATVVKDGFDGAGAGVGAGAGAGAGIVPADGDAAADHSGFGSDGTMSSGSDAHASRSVFGKKRPSYGTVDATVDGGVPSAI